jgi:ketosteroid isomerase-like protein
MTSDLHDFQQFMQRRADAARAYVRGDAAPLGSLVARVSPASFFGPQGGYVRGAEEVASRYANDATSFSPDGETQLEVLELGASDSVAYWVGFQHATVHRRGRAEPMPMKLRVTEVFRREDGAWKLVHRHADSLSTMPQDRRTSHRTG